MFCAVTSLIATICSPPSSLNFRPTVADELTIDGCAAALDAVVDVTAANAIGIASRSEPAEDVVTTPNTAFVTREPDRAAATPSERHTEDPRRDRRRVWTAADSISEYAGDVKNHRRRSARIRRREARRHRAPALLAMALRRERNRSPSSALRVVESGTLPTGNAAACLVRLLLTRCSRSLPPRGRRLSSQKVLHFGDGEPARRRANRRANDRRLRTEIGVPN